MTEQIKLKQFIWFLLSKANNKTKSNCSLFSKTNNQNTFTMMTNYFCNPFTTVPTNRRPDVSGSIINNYTYSTVLAQTQTFKYNAFYQYLNAKKSTLISNKVINTFLITFSSWRLKCTNNRVFIQHSTFVPPILSQHGPHQHRSLHNYNESVFSIFISFILCG